MLTGYQFLPLQVEPEAILQVRLGDLPPLLLRCRPHRSLFHFLWGTMGKRSSRFRLNWEPQQAESENKFGQWKAGGWSKFYICLSKIELLFSYNVAQHFFLFNGLWTAKESWHGKITLTLGPWWSSAVRGCDLSAGGPWWHTNCLHDSFHFPF